MGHANIRVVRKPNIAVIGVGDELTPPGEHLSESSIYESNTFGLSSLVEKMGGTPMRFDLIKDSLDLLRETLDEAAASCDAILTSGGVSMGEWDMVRRIMEEEGDIRFWKVLIDQEDHLFSALGGRNQFSGFQETRLAATSSLLCL